MLVASQPSINNKSTTISILKMRIRAHLLGGFDKQFGKYLSLDQIEKAFGVKPGDTTGDNKLGVQSARCIGACGLAPAVVFDNEIFAKVNPVEIEKIVKAKVGA
jgi:hypothetical protein